MYKKTITGLLILVVFLSIANLTLAEWAQVTPGIAGGDLTTRYGMGMASISGDKVLLFGGSNGSYFSDTWLYDADEQRWTELSPNIMGGTLGPTFLMGFSYIGYDRILMMGGRYNRYSTNIKADTWLFDFSENSWRKLSPIYEGPTWSKRARQGMAYLGGDKVLMFGGYIPYTDTNDTWIFNLTENKWTYKSPAENGGTLSARSTMMLSYIEDGKVLGFGGRQGDTFYNETWIYDLPADTWTKLSPIVSGGTLTARGGQGMTYIGGGRVLMFGGEIGSNNIGANDMWIYDLSENTWTEASDISGYAPTPRCFPGAAQLGSGKIILFGGINGADNFNDTWTFQVDGYLSSTLTAVPTTGGVTISWNVPSGVLNSAFYIYKNNKPITNTPIIGTLEGEQTIYSYFDSDLVPGTNSRYKVLEIDAAMNSEVFSREITVPYCP
ncbi:MAG: hypothetical protein HKM93_12515 [Desulfobacteraceae bacterium]|nr:hypothetical protein [Desulfobacteraceae bacterium]